MTPSAPDRERPALGEEEAMERAVREHAALVYRVARAVLRNHHDAEDAAQEVFLRVLRLHPRLEGVENTRTWFARVAFRVALDRRARPGLLSLDDVGGEGLRSAEAAADDVAADRQVRALVAEKVAALPGDLRHAVRLSTVAELSSPEIARVLGIPEGTVRTRLMRARRILRLSLAATMVLLLAAGAGFLLRKTKTAPEAEVSSKGGARSAAAPGTGAPPVPPPVASEPEKISSKGEETTSLAAPTPARTAASPSYPSKKIFFPSSVPLSEQERLLLAYVASPPTGPGTASGTAPRGFLDEPAPLPPLPEDSPSLD